MGGGGSRRDPSDQIRAAAAQARLQGEEEGKRIMQNCIASLEAQLRNSKSEMNQDRSWMKSTMETFLSSQSEMKDQYKDMLREMVQKDSFYAQERANADARHMQQLNAMKEERETMREGQERTLGSLRDDMRQERERIQRDQQVAMEAVRQDMKEDRERSQQDKAMLMETMKEEKELILKRHDDQVHTLKDEMKEERGTMQKNLNERVDAMNQEKQTMAKQHESHVQTLQTTMQEEKEILQKHLEDRVGSMAEERERLEQNYTGQIHTLREDSETMKKEKDEQLHTMKMEMTEDKHKMQEAYETRIQTEQEENKEEKARMREEHTQQLQEIKVETKEDKERMALTYDRHLQNVREDRNQERQSMARYHEHLMLMMERRDAQFSNMINYQQNTMSYLLESQIPSMIQYQQSTMDMLMRGRLPQSYGYSQLPPTGESQYGNYGNYQPIMVGGRNSPAISYQHGSQLPASSQMPALRYQPQAHGAQVTQEQMLYSPQHQQNDWRLRAAGNLRMDHEISRTQMMMTCQSAPGGPGQMNSPGNPEAEEKRREDTARNEVAATQHVQAQDPYAMPLRPSQSGLSAFRTPVHVVDQDSSTAAPVGQMGHDAAYLQQSRDMPHLAPQAPGQMYEPAGGAYRGEDRMGNSAFEGQRDHVMNTRQSDYGTIPPLRGFPGPEASPSSRFHNTGDDVLRRQESGRALYPNDPGFQGFNITPPHGFEPVGCSPQTPASPDYCTQLPRGQLDNQPRGESVTRPYSGYLAGEAAPFEYHAGGENSVGHEAGRMPPSIPQVGRLTPAGHQETSYPTNISDTGYEVRQFGQRRSMDTEVPHRGFQDLHGPMSPLLGYGVHDRQPFLSGGRGEGVAPLYGPGDAYPQSVGASGRQDMPGHLQLNLDGQTAGRPAVEDHAYLQRPSSHLPNGHNLEDQRPGREPCFSAAALPPAAPLSHRGTPDSARHGLPTASASRNREQAESGVTVNNPTDVADDEMEDMQSFETLSISHVNNQE